MEQIERISTMERMLDETASALGMMEEALNRYEEAQKGVAALADYLGSDIWREDLADDEQGKLPPTLKRGVLSEDGIWNLLEDNRSLASRMAEAASTILGSE